MGNAEFLNSSSAGLEGVMQQWGCELIAHPLILVLACSSSTLIHVFMALAVKSAVIVDN